MDKPLPLFLGPGEATPRPVSVLAMDPAGQTFFPSHSHRRGQLIHAISGVMVARAEAGSWVVPPGRAVWVPPGVPHALHMASPTQLRTVYVEPGARPGMAAECRVLEVGAMLRELIVNAAHLPAAYPLGGREERIMELILDEIELAPVLALHVPMPRHAALARLCKDFLAAPTQSATLEGWGTSLHMTPRTLARLMRRETGLNFGTWCRQARLLLSLPRLAAGASIQEVALAHGYESPSAFTAMFRKHLGVPPSRYMAEQG